MGTFWEIIASNAVVATILAIGAMLLGRIWKNAAALHVLWVVVLLKLFTPPLLTAELPVRLRTLSPSAAECRFARKSSELARAQCMRITERSPSAIDESPRARSPRTTGRRAPGIRPAGPPATGLGRSLTSSPRSGFVAPAAWRWSMPFAFAGLRASSAISRRRRRPSARWSTELSGRLGLGRAPDVLMTSRALPPLVWSIGLCPRVILPSELFARLSSEAQGTILAHELIHIRRGDHLVRLLELAATTVFWWHPVVWWASRQLHELEEQCCDGRVLELLPHQPRTYAAALVDTLEFLSERPRTPVPLPTAIDSTGSLSRRIHMLAQSRTTRLSALSAVLVAGLVSFRWSSPSPPIRNTRARRLPGTSQPPSARTAVLRGRVTNEAGAPPGRRPRARGHPRRRHAVRRRHRDARPTQTSWRRGPMPAATTGWRSPGSPGPRRSRSMR